MKRFVPAVAPAAVLVLDLAGLAAGWWWVAAPVAAVAALLIRGRLAAAAQIAAAVLAWAVDLALVAGRDTGRIAGLVGAVALGTAGQGWLALTATGVLALLLALAGGWLGAAVRRTLPSRPRAEVPVSPAPQEAAEPAAAGV